MTTKHILLGAALALISPLELMSQWNGSLDRGLLVHDSAFLVSAFSNQKGGATVLLQLENGGYGESSVIEVSSKGEVHLEWRSAAPNQLWGAVSPGPGGSVWSIMVGNSAKLVNLSAQGSVINETAIPFPIHNFASLYTDHLGGTFLIHSDSQYVSYLLSKYNSQGESMWEKPLVVDSFKSDPVQPFFYTNPKGDAYVVSHQNSEQVVRYITSGGKSSWGLRVGQVVAQDSSGRLILRSEYPAGDEYTFRHLLPSGLYEHYVDIPLPKLPNAEWVRVETAPDGSMLLVSRSFEGKGWRFFGRLISPSGNDLWGDWRSLMTTVSSSTDIPSITFDPHNEGFYLAFWDEDYVSDKIVSYLKIQRVTWAGRNEWLEEGIRVASDARDGRYNHTVLPLEDKVIIAYTEIPLNSPMYRPQVSVTALDKNGAPLGTSSVRPTQSASALNYEGSRDVQVSDQLGRLVNRFVARFEDLQKGLAELPVGWYRVSIDHETSFPYVVTK